MITPASHLWLRLHSHYRKGGHLATEILGQPNKYIEAMELLSSTFNEIELESIKASRAE